MKNFFTLLVIILSGLLYGQSEQIIQKTTGDESTFLNEIDSIHFNSDFTEMLVTLRSGITESHSISNINKVTFLDSITSLYPAGTVNCNGVPTAVHDVLNPTTGKTWMDRNLGARQVAVSSDDSLGFGSLYQWGRRSDGHQCRDSDLAFNLSSTNDPMHGDFITPIGQPFDWRSPANDNLWQGVNGINNPCPTNYRVPTEAELEAERLSWTTNDAAGAFSSPLKFVTSNGRSANSGIIFNMGVGNYWSSNVSGSFSRNLLFLNNDAEMIDGARASGRSVRCIKD